MDDFIDEIKTYFILLLLSVGFSLLTFEEINSNKRDILDNYVEISGIIDEIELRSGRYNKDILINLENNSSKFFIEDEFKHATDLSLFKQYILKGSHVSLKILKYESMGWIDKFNYDDVIKVKRLRYNNIEVINKQIEKKDYTLNFLIAILFIIIGGYSIYKLIILLIK